MFISSHISPSFELEWRSNSDYRSLRPVFVFHIWSDDIIRWCRYPRDAMCIQYLALQMGRDYDNCCIHYCIHDQAQPIPFCRPSLHRLVSPAPPRRLAPCVTSLNFSWRSTIRVQVTAIESVPWKNFVKIYRGPLPHDQRQQVVGQILPRIQEVCLHKMYHA